MWVILLVGLLLIEVPTASLAQESDTRRKQTKFKTRKDCCSSHV
jgi:hypothetical protein